MLLSTLYAAGERVAASAAYGRRARGTPVHLRPVPPPLTLSRKSPSVGVLKPVDAPLCVRDKKTAPKLEA